MNNNTVVLDLEKYDSMIQEIIKLRLVEKRSRDISENYFVLPKKDFYIDKEYDDEDHLVLIIDANVFRIIKEHFSMHDFEIRYPNAKISRYTLKITEKEDDTGSLENLKEDYNV